MIAASKAAKKQPKFGHGSAWVLAGVLGVVIIGCIAVFVILSKGKATEKETVRPTKGKIEEVEPSLSTNVVVDVEEPAPPPKPKKHPLKTYTDERGVLRYEGGARVITKPPARTILLGSGKPPIFEFSSENEIAGLLQIEPGDFLVGDIVYNQKFVDNFLESLKHPIVVTKDDDEETAALKRAVIDTKIEIKERYDAGEDIGALLTETRAELQKMGMYRETLREELLKLRREEGITAQELSDFTEAANKMLVDKGLPPFSMPKKILEQMLRKEMLNQ